MARTRTTTTKPSLMSRLKGRNTTKTTKTSTSTNPITGKQTTTQTTKTQSHGHGHGNTTHATGSHVTNNTAAHHHHRKPTMGDKVSGAMMKLRGSLTRRPGLKAAGTRRMHGTDGLGSHRVY